jgi:peptide/nickel transport system substrate-binding protein
MKQPRSDGLSSFVVVMACAFSVLCWPGRPCAAQSAPAAPGGTTDLLRSPPFDLIKLTDGTVLMVEPVSPRPLPPLEPASTKKPEKVKIRGSNEAVPLEGNIGLQGEPSRFKTPEQERAEAKEEDESLRSLKIHLLQEAEVRDYVIKRSSIRSIQYFEDMLLAEADRLVLSRDFTRAFECLLRVKSRNPAWAGLDEHVNRLLYREGSVALMSGDHDRGLRLLRELLSRRRDYPGLLEQLASAYQVWIIRALDLNEYSKGRRFLHELEEMAAEHPLVSELRDRFINGARKRMVAADSASGPRRQDALREALRIWPTLEGATDRYLRSFEELPTLDVAVVDVSYPLGPWVHSPADARITRLLYRPILDSDSDEALKGKAAGQLASELESTDLGRRLVFQLRSGILWSDGSRQVTAVDVARSLIDRCDPGSPRYEARWADLLDRVESPDLTRVEVRLNRPLLRPGAWFDGPVGPAHAASDGRIATSERERALIASGPFRCLSSSSGVTELLRRDETGPTSGTQAHGIRRIREVRYSRPGSAVEALLRGEVCLISHVTSGQLAALRNHDDIKVGRYAQPQMHLIALDGRQPVLKNRSLRRALSYAINRPALLEETLLRHPADEENAVADGPFLRASYANAPGVKPLEHNMMLAAMLSAAARKELGVSSIKLKFEYPAIPEAQAVVPTLVEAFGLIGLTVEAVERPESELEIELRSGRRFDMAYRAVPCGDPMLDAGMLIWPGVDAPPDSDALASAVSGEILQLLLKLERAGDLPTAKGILLQIDREARDELPVLPLWQLVAHYAWRAELTGPAEVSPQLYQGLQSWAVKPRIPHDPWVKP